MSPKKTILFDFAAAAAKYKTTTPIE